MRPRRTWIPALIFAVLPAAALLAGCGRSEPPGSPVALNDAKLRNVAELYRTYQINQGKPPKSARDLAPLGNLTPGGYEAIASGEVVVRWNATLPDTKEEPGGTPSTEVLAYFKTVPQEGGPVLLLDRTTRSMTADEFKAAKLAGTD